MSETNTLAYRYKRISVCKTSIVADSKILSSVTTEDNARHLAEAYKKFNSIATPQVTPLDTSENPKFQLVFGVEEVEILDMAGKQLIDVEVVTNADGTPLSDGDFLRLMLSRNFIRVALANYRTRYEMVKLVDAYIKEHPDDTWGWSTSSHHDQRVSDALFRMKGLGKKMINKIRVIGDFENGRLFNEMDEGLSNTAAYQTAVEGNAAKKNEARRAGEKLLMMLSKSVTTELAQEKNSGEDLTEASRESGSEPAQNKIAEREQRKRDAAESRERERKESLIKLARFQNLSGNFWLQGNHYKVRMDAFGQAELEDAQSGQVITGKPVAKVGQQLHFEVQNNEFSVVIKIKNPKPLVTFDVTAAKSTNRAQELLIGDAHRITSNFDFQKAKGEVNNMQP